MRIINDEDVKIEKVEMEGAKDVSIQILIGMNEGSDNIIMRYFRIGKNGHTPFHGHNYEHVIKVQKGKGVVVNEKEEEIEIEPGMSLYIAPNELHQFKNYNDEVFEFICIIPNQESKKK